MLDQRIEEISDYDVVVIGGGPSGCCAATAAARQGAKTLLLESSGTLGGMGTSGLVTCWTPFTDGEKLVYRGLAEHLFTESKRRTSTVDESRMHGHIPFDPEAVKAIYDEMVVDSGVDLRFFSQLCWVETEGRSVTRIYVAGRSGLMAYRARMFVDCTGDALLCHLAGNPCHMPTDTGGEVMPSTLCFILSNVNEEAFRAGPSTFCGNADSPIWDILASGKWPRLDIHLVGELVGPGAVGFNAGHLFEVDATNTASISAAMVEGRKIARDIQEALAEFYPDAFKDAFLASTAPSLGVRESRRIAGEYTLCVDDYFARRNFPDEIGRNCYYIDIHGAQSEQRAIASCDEFWAYMKRHKTYNNPDWMPLGKGESHGIPFRSLVPRDLDNVLAAGRCISCDRPTLGSVRVMAPSMVTGQAAGTAAALACADKAENIRQVDIPTLRDTLQAQGAWFN